ncbi:extracellular catalytic domain type 2 short-chain-length polyhydroxyalkanoate depolymerase [Gallaecimonas mangrovi]|uniref:extracellular catalytic domain type 2 short-chain-length polyhydroxyalkanoate depolymerase n=1 Tax=Gallaecimonas mangrovi TaxID=2291597 RepID=UPI000E2055D1|nr:PHB depolymerase family esterase [Gallaecimonas mangrovi]
MKAFLSVVVLAVVISFRSLAAAPPLPALGADIQQTSVSGLSSGAFMTSQLFVAHSDIMIGAGIIAGGPYLCAMSWPSLSLLVNATTTCMNPLTASVAPPVAHLVSLTKGVEKKGEIDSLSNLAKTRLYVFSGESDTTVTTLVVNRTVDYYKALGVPEDAIAYNTSVNAGHAIITDDPNDTSCAKTAPPFINDCDFEQASRIIKQIFPNAKAAADTSPKAVAFNQAAFFSGNQTSMSDTAYYYAPKACLAGKHCPVHVVLHGCEQGATEIGDKYYDHTGYNQMADANDIIMLYPQVQKSAQSPFNPKGCWDFWGYSSGATVTPDFYSRNAPQIKAIFSMIERLASAPGQ